MWWGSGEGAESATEAAEAAPEMDDMKEQFAMQQNLIKQLKDMVKTHQTQLEEKEQQVQVCTHGVGKPSKPSPAKGVGAPP